MYLHEIVSFKTIFRLDVAQEPTFAHISFKANSFVVKLF